MNIKREKSLLRANELKKKAHDYLVASNKITTGYELKHYAEKQKNKLLEFFNATQEDWENWHWQLEHRISNTDMLLNLFKMKKDDVRNIKSVETKYRWSISPYYMSLMHVDDKFDPIRMQSIPSIEELDLAGELDPMGEEYTSPAPCIVRRYPDRVVINVTNQCAMYCRHCQRRRNIGEVDVSVTNEQLQEALKYINDNEEIRDVLITGGDAFLLSNNRIEWILEELDKIDHIEIKRFGTRTLVSLPQRITDGLCEILRNHPPVYVNTQFNHPEEITEETKIACDKLISAGVILGNQSVLLKGVNNDPNIIKKLNHELLKIRVRPYYIFQAKMVKGTSHFITSIDEGINIMDKLRGYTSGLAIPTYVVNAPYGKGKIPILPRYFIKRNEDNVILQTWEHETITYPNRMETLK